MLNAKKISLAERRGKKSLNLSKIDLTRVSLKGEENMNHPPSHNRTMITFDDIRKYNWQSPPKSKLNRRPDIQFFYTEHLSYVKKTGKELDEYIIDSIFNGSDINYKLVKNDYPYWINDAEHWICWINPMISDPDVIEITERSIKKHFNNKKTVCFENEYDCRTVTSIRHTHIFVKV